MALTLQYPPLQRTPASVKYRVAIDGGSTPGLPSSTFTYFLNLGGNFCDTLTAGSITLSVTFSNSTTQTDTISLATLQAHGHVNTATGSFSGIVPPPASIVSCTVTTTAFALPSRPIVAQVSVQRSGQPTGELILRHDARSAHTTSNDCAGYAKIRVNQSPESAWGTAIGGFNIYPALTLVNNDHFTIPSGAWHPTTYEFQVNNSFVPVPGRITLDVRGMAVSDIQEYLTTVLAYDSSLAVRDHYWDGVKYVINFSYRALGWYGDVAIVSGVADGVNFQISGFSGSTPPSVKVDTVEGPFRDYIQSLLSSYYPANVPTAVAYIAANTQMQVLLTGPGASICRAAWYAEQEYETPLISLGIGLTAAAPTAPTYVDVELHYYGDDSVQDPITVVTTLGSLLLARQELGDIAFAPTHFAVGDYGFNPSIPKHPLPVSPDDSSLTHELYRAPIERFEAPNDSTLAVICRIPSGTLRCAVGEIGVLVTLTAVNNNTPLFTGGPVLSVGDVFLFGLTHTAMRCVSYDQTDLHAMTFAL